MMKRSHIMLVATLLITIGYVLIFLRSIPRISPVQSRFSVACDTNTDVSGNGFGEIAGKYVSVESKSGANPRTWSYVISDPTWDVVSKVICNGGQMYTTESARQLYQVVNSHLNDPNVIEAHSKPVNYEVVMTGAVYDRSWASYILKILGLIVVVGLIWWRGKLSPSK